MGDVARTAVLLAVLVHPFAGAAVLAPAFAPGSPLLAAGAVAVALVVAALLAEPILDGLTIAPETAQIAAGILALVPALRLLWKGTERALLAEGTPPARAALVPVAFPVLAGPAVLAAVIARAPEEGTGITIAAVVLVALVTLGVLALAPTLERRAPWLHALAGRLGAGAMVVAAFDLIVDGVLAV